MDISSHFAGMHDTHLIYTLHTGAFPDMDGSKVRAQTGEVFAPLAICFLKNVVNSS